MCGDHDMRSGDHPAGARRGFREGRRGDAATRLVRPRLHTNSIRAGLKPRNTDQGALARADARMPSLLDSADHEAILQRLRRLQPSFQPRWGRFTAPRMVCHLADSLRVGLGDLSARRVDTLPRRTLFKWVVVYSPLPVPPGKVQTAPEMLATEPTDWAEDVAAVSGLIGANGHHSNQRDAPLLRPPDPWRLGPARLEAHRPSSPPVRLLALGARGTDSAPPSCTD